MIDSGLHGYNASVASATCLVTVRGAGPASDTVGSAIAALLNSGAGGLWFQCGNCDGMEPAGKRFGVHSTEECSPQAGMLLLRAMPSLVILLHPAPLFAGWPQTIPSSPGSRTARCTAPSFT